MEPDLPPGALREHIARLERELAEARAALERERESAALRSTVVEHWPEALLLSSLRDGRILLCNRAFEDASGFGRAEVLGRTTAELGLWADPSQRERMIEELRTRERVLQLSIQLRRRDGGVVLGMFSARRVEVAGEPCLVSVFYPVTEEQLAAEALKASERRLRQIIDLVPHFIFAKDAEGRFILVNQAVAEAYGTTVEELTGRTDADFARSAEEARHFRADDLEVLRSQRPRVVPEEVITDARGRVRHLSTVKIPFTFSGTTSPAVLGVAVDITGQRRAEQALREGERRYRLLFESAGEAIFILQDDRFIDCNQAALEMFRCGREHIVGRHPWDLSPPSQPDGGDSRARAAAAMGGVEAGARRRLEWTHRRADGTDFLAEVTLSAFPLESGRHLQAIVRDITEQRRAEEALQRSEGQLRAVIANAPFGAHFYELRPDGRLVFTGANPAADRILGVGCADFVGLDILEAFPALADTDIPAAYRRVATAGVPFDHDQVDYDHGAIRGAYEVHAFATTPGRLAVFFHDVTERRRAAEALTRSEANYRLLAENLTDVIWTMGLDMRLTYVSPSIAKMHGGRPEAWIGRAMDEYMSPESVELARATFAHELAEHGVPPGDPNRYITIEIEQRRTDGTPFATEVTARLMRDAEGRPIGAIGVTRDITDRRAAEAEHRRLAEQLMQAQKMESVGRLAGGVAHDLNNMLTPILGHADLLRSEMPPDDPRRSRVAEILVAGERCRDLVQRLLAFARKQTFAVRPLDLYEAVRGFEGMLRRTLREDVAIRLLTDGRRTTIEGDKGQIEQILMNLAVNAQDAMPNGGTLTLATAAVPAPEPRAATGERPGGPRVRLEVTDTGIGMDDDTLSRLFEPFFTTKGPGHGTGLGLSTVYGIVQQHRGTIDVESAPGRGTTFRIQFPAAAHPADEPPAAPEIPREPPGGRGTVLVVEDEELVRTLAVEVLRSAGYTVLEAADCRTATRVSGEHRGVVDLLLTDVVLPDDNGRVLHERLAASRPGLRALFMSGYTADVIGHHGVLEPGVDFIQKPFTVRALAAKVGEILARR